MLTKMIWLSEKVGFHARPAGQVAAAARKYRSMITLQSDEWMADAKSALSVMRLGFPPGGRVEIISDGVAYRSILTGRERGKNTKLVFGTVRLDLTKILRRGGNGQ